MTTKKAKQAETQSILDYFANLPDPRRDNENRRHKLISIIAIAILATICGAEHFTEMEEWGEDNADWLRTFLELVKSAQGYVNSHRASATYYH